jgi:ribosome-associated protein
VNKRETKAELYFNIPDSQYLTVEQKIRLIQLGGHRVHHEEHILIMTCQEERFQEANKEKVIHHFRQLLEEILPEPKKRVATKIPKQSKEARLSEKKREGQKKTLRQKPRIEE